MIRGKGHYRKPDPLLVLAAAVVLGAVLTTAAMAGETFNMHTRIGQEGAEGRSTRQDPAGDRDRSRRRLRGTPDSRLPVWVKMAPTCGSP